MTSSTKYTLSWGGFFVTLAGAVLFSTKAVFVKLAFGHTRVDAVTLLAVRMVFALPFYLVAAFLVSRRKDNVRFSGKEWLYVSATGALGYYLSSLFDFIGLQYISAGLELLILFLYPSFVVFINAFFFRQPISFIQKTALFLTYLGIGVAYFGELAVDADNPHFYFGSLMVLLCAATYSVYIVGSGRLIQRVGANKYTAYAMLAATAGVLLHFLVANAGQHLEFGPDIWGYGVLLAVFATVLPTFMLARGLQSIGSNNVAIISGIGPVSTILQAHFVLGEQLFFAQLLGTASVVAGVILIGWQRNPVVLEEVAAG